MKLLLDENFPIQLYHRLRQAGKEVEHLTVSGQRGLPDAAIRDRLGLEEDLVLLTQDTEFEQLADGTRGLVVISGIPHALPIEGRVELWLRGDSAVPREASARKPFRSPPHGQDRARRGEEAQGG